MTPPLAILRGHERAAWLLGPRAVIDAIAAASGLVARDCADDRARVIEHAHEDALAAACVAAGYASPPRTCTLCDASERGACVVHRRPVVDCARCGTRHYGPTPPACVFCGAVFSVAAKGER